MYLLRACSKILDKIADSFDECIPLCISYHSASSTDGLALIVINMWEVAMSATSRS
jgi:hypothetical protein